MTVLDSRSRRDWYTQLLHMYFSKPDEVSENSSRADSVVEALGETVELRV